MTELPDLQSTALAVEALRHGCDPTGLSFKTTDDLVDVGPAIGQARAVEAIGFALAMDRTGYNLFAIGPEGLGKRSILQHFLEQSAQARPVPAEYCYVNNFANPQAPKALCLPPGRGRQLKEAMVRFVGDVKASLTSAFTGEDYRSSTQAIEQEASDKQATAMKAVQEEAEERGIALLRTPTGFGLAPVKDGSVLSPKEFQKLPEDEQSRITAVIEALEKKLQQAVRNMPVVLAEARDQINALNEKTARFAIAHMIERAKGSFGDLPDVLAYLDAVERDVVTNAASFLNAPEQPSGDGGAAVPTEGPAVFWRYRVNLLIDHGDNGVAPVVYEDEPTFERLVGRIEHRAEQGTLSTDFNLVRPGSLHRANGGYLLIDAFRLLRQPLAWDALKRALEAGVIRIESLAMALGFASTITLEPEPIPLSVKVVLFGERRLYYLLAAHDPDFSRHFKVLADFDEALDRTAEHQDLLARSVATIARRERLRPFEASAVAALIDEAARQAGDNKKLSTDVEHLGDLMREAAYLAGQDDQPVVRAADVAAARAAKVRRTDRFRERLQEAMERDTILVDTTGAAVGQVNGLSVYRLGDAGFGRPARITARVRLGKGDVIDIEREVKLGGPLHSKGVLILSGYLGARYAADHPLSLSATLVFEQSYGGVEGDSASAAELCALVSALSDVPIRQNLAITGSINQHGQMQAIGGVNEKVEGFFDLCKARGLTGDQGVVIPRANVEHLMLHERVIDAVRAGSFQVHAVDSIDQGIEILTGTAAGTADAAGHFPPETVNGRVMARLLAFAERRRAFARGGEGEPG